MNKLKCDNKIISHKDSASNAIEDYISSLIDSGLEEKANKLCYWLEEYMKLLKREKNFKPNAYPDYQPGQIVKVNLGYNVGSEEGGLHYAVVVGNKNSKRSPVLNVIPLTSVKNNTDIKRLKNGQVFLGSELYDSLATKKMNLSASKNQNPKAYLPDSEIRRYAKERKEFSKMKKESIALVNQITTVSKMRIYAPKRKDDALYKVILSNESLRKIEKAIIELYVTSPIIKDGSPNTFSYE